MMKTCDDSENREVNLHRKGKKGSIIYTSSLDSFHDLQVFRNRKLRPSLVLNLLDLHTRSQFRQEKLTLGPVDLEDAL